MLDSAKGKIVAGVGMMACCGLSMAIALGLIAFSSTLLISGFAVALGCIAFMLAFGHRHQQRHNDHEATPEHVSA